MGFGVTERGFSRRDFEETLATPGLSFCYNTNDNSVVQRRDAEESGRGKERRINAECLGGRRVETQ